MTKTLTRGTKGVLASLAVAATLASVSLASPTTANAALAPNSACAGDSNKYSGQCYTKGSQYFWLGSYSTPTGKAWCLDYLYDTTWKSGAYQSGGLKSALGGGVGTAEQQALAYLATYHAPSTTGSTDAAAISLIIREVMGDGVDSSEGRVYPSGLTVGKKVTNPTGIGGVTSATLNRANALWTEAANKRGSWNLSLTPVTSHGNYNDSVTYTVKVTSSVTNKGISGATVSLTSSGLSNAPSSVKTNSSGVATFTAGIASTKYSVKGSIQSPGSTIRVWVPSGWKGRTSSQTPTTAQRVLGTATSTTKTAAASGTGTAPTIGTTATDKVDNDKFVVADGGTIIDKVAYKNLSVNKKYTVTGTLQDKATGKPVTVDGKNVTGTTTFTPTTTSGTVDVPITVPANALAGKTVVAFETISYNGKAVVSHTDIDDEGQTVYIPKIGTTATDQKDNDKFVLASGGTIIDKVAYNDLKAGEKYTVTGVLQDKATGKPVLVNGKQVAKTVTFTATTSDGTVDVPFTVPADALAGKTVVAFETVSYNGKEVAVHNDINDTGQTVYIPKIHTTATDKKDGDHTIVADGDQTVTDAVSYTGLEAGKKYDITGVLQDKATGKPLLVNGKTVTKTVSFTAEKADGVVNIDFTVPASALAGKTVVVFETAYNNGKEVAIHNDLTDESQTVYIPKIGTTLTDTKDGDHQLVAAGGPVVDTIAYSNLQPGQKYDVSGVLMNKADGKSTGITGRATFTPKTSNGTVKVSYQVPAGHQDQTLVAFETVTTDVGKHAVATHSDINDKAQAVGVARPATPPSTPSSPSSTPSVGVSAGDPTGHDGWGPLAGVGAAIIIVGLAGGGYAVYRNRRAGAHE
jgi:hypothetical protein